MTDIEDTLNKKNLELIIATLKKLHEHGLKIPMLAIMRTDDSQHINVSIDEGFIVVIKTPAFKSVRVEADTENEAIVEKIVDRFNNVTPISIEECKELIVGRINRKKRKLKEHQIIAAGGSEAVDGFFDNMISFVMNY